MEGWVMEEKLRNRECKKWNGPVCRDWNIQTVASKAEFYSPHPHRAPSWLSHLPLAGVPLTLRLHTKHYLKLHLSGSASPVIWHPQGWEQMSQAARTWGSLAGLSEGHKGGNARILPSWPAHRDQQHDKATCSHYRRCGAIASFLALWRREVRGARTDMHRGYQPCTTLPEPRKKAHATSSSDICGYIIHSCLSSTKTPTSLFFLQTKILLLHTNLAIACYFL